jgi:predicted O-methyltransferase YrrM
MEKAKTPGFSPTAPLSNAQAAMAVLDAWVARRGNGRYFPLDLKAQGPFEIAPSYGIQQVRDEISEFAKTLVERRLNGTVIEVGLGYFGSTHFLWRLLFKNVVTVEMSVERCRAFVDNFADFSEGYSCGDDGRSKFIYGASQNPAVVRKAYEAVNGKADLLFIDGDHSYAGVLCDWLLYHKLVRRGGLVAFHDVATPKSHISEVPRLLQQLESGEFDGIRRPMTRIISTEHTGIGFYVCE